MITKQCLTKHVAHSELLSYVMKILTSVQLSVEFGILATAGRNIFGQFDNSIKLIKPENSRLSKEF